MKVCRGGLQTLSKTCEEIMITALLLVSYNQGVEAVGHEQAKELVALAILLDSITLTIGFFLGQLI